VQTLECLNDSAAEGAKVDCSGEKLQIDGLLDNLRILKLISYKAKVVLFHLL
jgi:hypothetical protein